MILYGIPNCDSCRKARKWLEGKDVPYRFHDLRDDGIDRSLLNAWVAKVDWKTLLNTRSTTWRSLPAADKADLTQSTAAKLMLAHPTLIKRPVLEVGSKLLVGFSESAYESVRD